MSSQSVPFPCEDLSVGPCNCGPILDSYKKELELVRKEVEGRVSELEAVREEMAALQAEHQETLAELESSRSNLQDSLVEKALMEEEVLRVGLLAIVAEVS